MKQGIRIGQIYTIECFDKNGNQKWQDGFENIVVNSGLDHYLDATLKTGSVSPTWFVGLKNAVPAVASDTISSKGFAELTPYSNATRPSLVLGTITVGAVDNSASKATFTINANATVAGGFLVNNNTKGGSTGVLLGAGEFTSARAVESGDTLTVQVNISMTSV